MVDGSSGSKSSKRVRERKTSQQKRFLYVQMMERKMLFQLFLNPRFFNVVFCMFEWRIGWILIYHCLIISPRLAFLNKKERLSIPCDCYLMFFHSGFCYFLLQFFLLCRFSSRRSAAFEELVFFRALKLC